jgi:hypothetical protein
MVTRVSGHVLGNDGGLTGPREDVVGRLLGSGLASAETFEVAGDLIQPVQDRE